MRDIRWLGFDWGEHLYHASDYFEQLYQWAEQLVSDGQGVRRQPDGRSDARVPRHADRARQRQPVSAIARSRRTSTSFAACGPASSTTAPTCCARRSTWRRATSTCAIRSCTASARRRISAPATRGASIRCTTGPTASRTPSSASPTRSARSSTKTTGRCTTGISTRSGIYHPRQIEFARLNLNYTVMSKRTLLELVEAKHVDGWDDPRMPTIVRAAAPRLHAGIDPQFLRAHRRRQARERRRHREPRARDSRRSQRARAARDGRAESAEGRHRELPRRAGRRGRRHQQPGGSRRRERGRCRSARCSISSATTSWRTRRRSSSGSSPGNEVRLRCAYFIKCTGVVKDARPARLPSCARPTIRPRAAAIRQTAAR